MELALVLNILLALGFVVLPGVVAFNAFRRFRLSRSSNRPVYAGVTIFALLSVAAMVLPFLLGNSPGVVSLSMSILVLPVWVLVRAFCGVNPASTGATLMADRIAQEV